MKMVALDTTITPECRKILPDGWRWVRLGEVCELNPHRPESLNRFYDTPTTFIPMSAIDERKGIVTRPELKHYADVRKGYTYFAEGDVLFAKITPCMQNGKHAIAHELVDAIGFGSTEFHVIRPGPKISAEWIHFFVRQPSVLLEATSYFTGTVGQQRVPSSFLASIKVPLPPLPEQKRIATILTEQMAAVDQARSAAEVQLEAAKALPGAFLRTIFNSSESRQWSKKRLGEVSRLVSGGTPPRGNTENFMGVIPWVKTLDLNCAVVRTTEEHISESALAQIRGEILPVGTVMVAMYGGAGTIGKSGILGLKAVTNQAICSILPNPRIYNSEFLHAWLLFIRPEWMRYSGGNRKDPNINKGVVEKMECPMPPLPVQQRIATILNKQIATVDRACKALEEQLDIINKLPAALIRRAFRGEL